MASFSSRGGTGQTLGISKPDVTAPGVQILAGNTSTPSEVVDGPSGQLFQAIAGTSMSAPHVAGAGALLHAAHPTWTPGQIHSALMTTANTATFKENGTSATNSFDDGSGRINITNANSPFFTIDTSGALFNAYKSALYKANYPSLYIPTLAGKLAVTRNLKDVSGLAKPYTVTVAAPADLKVTVTPAAFTIPANGSQTVTITVDGSSALVNSLARFATITFHSGTRTFTFPVTAVRRQGPVSVTKTCTPNPIKRLKTVTCTVTMANRSLSATTAALTDVVPSRFTVSTVTGATRVGNKVTTSKAIAQRTPSNVTVAELAAFPYTPITVQDPSVTPEPGFTDDSVEWWTLPAPLTFAGVTYNDIGVSSNGLVVLGVPQLADATPVNQSLPNPARPNTTIAAFWTDLNVEAGGAIYLQWFQDTSVTPVSNWFEIAFEGVPEFTDHTKTHSFQITLGLNTNLVAQRGIWVDYGPNSGDGDRHLVTIGAENSEGNRGQNLCFNCGAGVSTVEGFELKVNGVAQIVRTAVVKYTAKAVTAGTYNNYASVDQPAPGGHVGREVRRNGQSVAFRLIRRWGRPGR